MRNLAVLKRLKKLEKTFIVSETKGEGMEIMKLLREYKELSRDMSQSELTAIDNQLVCELVRKGVL